MFNAIRGTLIRHAPTIRVIKDVRHTHQKLFARHDTMRRCEVRGMERNFEANGVLVSLTEEPVVD